MIDIERILEIEEVKKEADKLMIAKVTKYENEIAELKKELQQVQKGYFLFFLFLLILKLKWDLLQE